MSSHVLVPGAVSCRVEYMRRQPFSLSLTHMKLSMDNLYWFPDSCLQNILSSSNPGVVHFVELYQRKHCLINVKLFLHLYFDFQLCVSSKLNDGER